MKKQVYLLAAAMLLLLILASCAKTEIAANSASAEQADVSIAADILHDITGLDQALITEETAVGDWVYFMYPSLGEALPESARALYRCRANGEEFSCISPNTYDSYEVINGSVYFSTYPRSGREHGGLYAVTADEEPVELASELYAYQIVDGFLYYTHSYDTVGVGIEGHALHRIDLDGLNHMIAAYEIHGPGIASSMMGEIRGGYVYYENIRMKLGEPATGMEKVEVTAPLTTDDDDGWIYYATNRLIKSKPDGSEQIVLDGDESTWIYIGRMDDLWIYYHQQAYSDKAARGYFKISRDGANKTEIDYAEFYQY